MTRKRFDIIDVIVAFTLGFLCGSLLFSISFSSPSSEARFRNLESGFLKPNRIKSGSTLAGVGIRTRRPTPAYIVTAYCPCEKCCGIYSDGITASGHIIEPNDCFVAAPPEIPFGTLLTIEGYAGGSMVSVEDRGGKIKGNRLDVFFGGKDGHEEALVWGVREYRIVRNKL